MDINTFRGIATITVMIAFLAVCWWAFSPKRRKRFKDAAQLPFADESAEEKRAREESDKKRSQDREADKD